MYTYQSGVKKHDTSTTLIKMTKVCKCHLVTFLNQTYVSDWCVIRRGSKNTHHKDTRLKEVRLHLQFYQPH